jgi:hypothetical protein
MFGIFSSWIFAARRLTRLRVFLLFLTVAVISADAGTQTVWLGWDPPQSEANIIEYRIFSGTKSGVYTNFDTSYEANGEYVYGLEQGRTYYFAVSAIDADGHVSPLSKEFAYTVPVVKPVPLQTQLYYDGNGVAFAMGFTASWEIPLDWRVDCSYDLVNWQGIAWGHGTDFASYYEFAWADRAYFRLVFY